MREIELQTGKGKVWEVDFEMIKKSFFEICLTHSNPKKK